MSRSSREVIDYRQALKDVLSIAHTKKILVIGDIMLDTYITGEVTRRSPEAPVNILSQIKKTHHLGGAGNTANNLASLGVQTTLIGIIGDDTEAKIIKNLANDSKIRAHFITDSKRPTTSKTRIVDSKGHIIRIDNESTATINKVVETKIISHINSLPSQHAVIVSDYAKGVVTPRIVRALEAKFGADKLFVDTKPKNIKCFKKVFLIKLNATETNDITGICPTSQTQTLQAITELKNTLTGNIAITRGSRGIALFEHTSEKITFIKPHKVTVRDVTGAGDTTLAITALVATDHNLITALTCANYVASLAVAQRGTTALNIEKLQ